MVARESDARCVEHRLEAHGGAAIVEHLAPGREHRPLKHLATHEPERSRAHQLDGDLAAVLIVGPDGAVDLSMGTPVDPVAR